MGAWHRVTFDRPDSTCSASCSCGEKFDESMYAIGHAYSANAILEDEALTISYSDKTWLDTLDRVVSQRDHLLDLLKRVRQDVAGEMTHDLVLEIDGALR